MKESVGDKLSRTFEKSSGGRFSRNENLVVGRVGERVVERVVEREVDCWSCRWSRVLVSCRVVAMISCSAHEAR